VKDGETDLRSIPSAISGDRDKRTGVILAKSIPAKRFGIKTGEPVAMALRKCPDLVLAKPDFRLYERSSKAFMDICRNYAPVVEKFSIDECFLDMTGTHLVYPDPIALAYKIKDEIRDTLGFTVNVGIGSNKLLAKMASDFEKPDKVHTLFDWEIPDKMWPLPIGDLFTVGRSTAEKLEKMGIRTIDDLAHTSLHRVQQILGAKPGQQLWAYANGKDDSPVSAERWEAKGYSISTTLEEDVKTAGAAHRILLQLADAITARMRAEQTRAYCIAVTIRGNDFKNKSHQRSLASATDVTDEVYSVSRALFDELWDGVTPLRLLGISLTNLTKDEYAQTSLFPDEKKERSRKLDKAMDSIRSKYGSDSLTRGANLTSTAKVGRKYQAQLEWKKEKK
jgi:DNA polymerase-4